MGVESIANNELCIVSHRCLGFGAPANSALALTRALQSGVDEVELDFRLTRDGVFVASHSPVRLSKHLKPVLISNITEIEATAMGCLSLTQALALFAERGANKRLRVEIKTPGSEEYLLKTISDYGVLDRVVLVSWKTSTLKRLRQLSPTVSLSLSCIIGFHGDGILPLAFPSTLPTSATDTDIRLESLTVLSVLGSPCPNIIKKLRERKLDVFVIGTLQGNELERLRDLGVSGVLTSSKDFLVTTGRWEEAV